MKSFQIRKVWAFLRVNHLNCKEQWPNGADFSLIVVKRLIDLLLGCLWLSHYTDSFCVCLHHFLRTLVVHYTHSLITLTHYTHSLTSSFTHSFISLTHYTYSLAHSFTYSLIHSSINPSIYSFIQLSNCLSSAHSTVFPFIHQVISLIRPKLPSFKTSFKNNLVYVLMLFVSCFLLVGIVVAT